MAPALEVRANLMLLVVVAVLFTALAIEFRRARMPITLGFKKGYEDRRPAPGPRSRRKEGGRSPPISRLSRPSVNGSKGPTSSRPSWNVRVAENSIHYPGHPDEN
jgi:hypothetical protein